MKSEAATQQPHLYLVREERAARRHGQYVEYRGTDDGADTQIALRHEGADEIDEQFRTGTRGRHHGRAGHILGDIKFCRHIFVLFTQPLIKVVRNK